MKVSIIIPVYNAEITIRETLDSVLSQTYTNFEILICLDACTDNTESIVKSFNDQRIKILVNDFNLGAGKSRDKAINQATGDWFSFIDADDLWERSRLEKIVKLVIKYPLMVIFDNLFIFSNSKNIKLLRGDNAFSNQGLPKLVSVMDLIESPTLLLQPTFSRNLLELSKAEHSHHAYGEDTFFLLKLCAYSEGLIYIPDALYGYRVGHLSASTNPNKYSMLIDVYQKLLPEFDKSLEIKNALLKKINLIKIEEDRFYFTQLIKNKKIISSIYYLIKKPCVIYYVFKHNIEKLTLKK